MPALRKLTHMPIIQILCPFISYISQAILPLFALSFPDSLGIMSRPLFASISISRLLFGCSFIELCMFPVYRLWTCFRVPFLVLYQPG